MLTDVHGTPTLEANLDRRVTQLLEATYANATKRSYSLHLRTYLNFCEAMGYTPVPASTATACRYAAFLSFKVTYSTISQYMNIISLIHAEFGLPNPIIDNFNLICVMKGIRRTLGDAVRRKTPITPLILRKILLHMQVDTVIDSAIWAACLTAFFAC